MREDYGEVSIQKKLSYIKSFYPAPSLLAQKMFYYVVGVGHFVCQPDFHLYRCKYNNILVKYTVAGRGRLKYRGKTYDVGPGQIMMIKCFDVHEYYTYECDAWENKWVHLYGGMAYEYFNTIYEHFGPVITMPEGCRIPELIDRLIQMQEQNDEHFESNASVILLHILTEIFNQIPVEKIKSSCNHIDSSINRAILFIEDNYAHPITLEDMANASNYSLSHFIRAFEKVTDTSPYQYLQRYRVNQSKKLLTSTNLSIAKIAEQVGFTNSNSFIRNFYKSEKQSPTDYRQNY